MPKVPQGNVGKLVEIPFPMKGIDSSMGYEKQPAGTCRLALNVQGYDTRFHVFRGAQRQGISDHLGSAVNLATAIQNLNSVFQISTGVPSSLDTRTIRGVAVANGTVKSWAVGTGGLVAVTNGPAALADNGAALVIFSAEHTGKLYFADGINYKVYTASSNQVDAWTASAGTIPANAGEKPRLICNWRGRIVLSGIRGDEQNWFMSRQGNPLDWDYAPDPVDEQQAVAGNNSLAGKVGDVITALIPLNDDVLLFGADHTIWKMTGDPMAGGRIDLITDTTGIAWGAAYCRDSAGNLYFVGNRGGVFLLPVGGSQVQRISASIDDRFNILAQAFNSAQTIISMAWDEIQQGFFLYLTPIGGGAAVNYFYDLRNKAFWPQSYANNSHNPRCVYVLDGDRPNDRVVLLGCQDSRVRKIDLSVNTDDGYAISSYVVIGPIHGKNMASVMLKELQATFNMQTDIADDTVTWELFTGPSAQRALRKPADWPTTQVQTDDNDAVMSGTWGPGRNRSTVVRQAGTDFYIKISHTNKDKTFALETLLAKMADLGPIRQRAF